MSSILEVLEKSGEAGVAEVSKINFLETFKNLNKSGLL